MTVLEFWGCTLIAFGPPLAMFSLTVASDPIKVILLISASFFWLLSFLSVAVCWSIISLFCDYLIIGAYLAVLSQEIFRYLFYIVTKKAQIYLAKLLASEDLVSDSSGRNEIILNEHVMKFQEKFRMSYGKYMKERWACLDDRRKSSSRLNPTHQHKRVFFSVKNSIRFRLWSYE
jgi:hypothetical protein